MIRSLYGKFTLFTICIMFISALLSFLAVNTYYHQQLREQNDEKNMNIVKSITHYIEGNADLNLNDYLATQANVGYKLILVDENGNQTLFGQEFRDNNLSNQAMESVLNGNVYHGMRDLPKETFVTGFFSDESENTVGAPVVHNDQTYALFLRPDIKMLFTEVHRLLGGMMIAMAIISLIAMIFVARKLIQPITELTAATKKIGAEQFSITLPRGRSDEIGQLAVSFQNMADQLSESDKMRKQFINDVSHDFQTPLQNIKGYAELLDDKGVLEQDRHHYTTIIQEETERLSGLTKQLLLLTSLDSLTTEIDFQVVQIHEQLKDVLQRYRWLMDDKDISLSAEIEEVAIYGNKAYLEKIWENLLSNALKYTGQGGNINISLISSNNNIVIIFQDDGIGISEDNIPQLFNRFYRVDEARHSGIEGTGLGLAIVKQVVTLHNGTIEVDSELGKGTTFTINLSKGE